MYKTNKYEKNDKVILKLFQQILERLARIKCILSFTVNIENLKTLKYLIFLKKALVLSFTCGKCDSEDKKI